MKLLATTAVALALGFAATGAYAQSATDNPVTNNENYSQQGSNAPGYAGYGHPTPTHHRRHRPAMVQGSGAAYFGGNPVTNNENYTTQGSNAPGYAGYGHPGDWGNGAGWNGPGWFGAPAPYDAAAVGYDYGNPVTNNENYTHQGSNAPGYAGYGHPSGWFGQ